MKSESSIFLKDAQILLQAMADDPWEEWYSTTILPPVEFQFLYKIQSKTDTAVWKGETIDGQYVTIETLNDYVAFGIGYTSYDRDNNIKLVGLGNKIDVQDIDIVLNKLNINKPDVYHDFGW